MNLGLSSLFVCLEMCLLAVNLPWAGIFALLVCMFVCLYLFMIILGLALQSEAKRLFTHLFADAADIDWKTTIYSVPKGVMAFACRAATNSLATPDNLARWGRIVDPRCKLCTHSPCTLGHLLSNCKVALDQGRFTYRHDQVLLYLLKTLAAPGLEGLTFYSDLEGWKIGGGSIPPEIIVTAQRART